MTLVTEQYKEMYFTSLLVTSKRYAKGSNAAVPIS